MNKISTLINTYFNERTRQRLINWLTLTLGKLYIDACIYLRAAAFKLYTIIYWTLVSCCRTLFSGSNPRVLYAELDGVDITFETKVAYKYPRGNTNTTIEDVLETLDWFKGKITTGNIFTLCWLGKNYLDENEIRVSKIDINTGVELNTGDDVLFRCINFAMIPFVRQTQPTNLTLNRNLETNSISA
ncbi:hypothetical protein E24_00122 [Faustovirus]|nr:hypothetical protein PRJ_Fausto_00110 [Faustovirus]AMN83054.1 hypothetical protein E24_00122 [Faustovirus]AMN84038.1 hypothetical protein D5a_00122 [Faustovirus]AMN85024.1 hypothetical protein E23_00122 [Faustovirus]QBR99024.1 hypothetical protein [Faustovirus mariensis]